MPTQRPPDLDAAGQPLDGRPPDLDESGQPIFRSEMARDAQGNPIVREVANQATDWLPQIGGIAGGLIGGAGGTAFGFGFGGPLGAVEGAALGGAGGEAFKQLINRARGRAAPTTSTEAATDIGLAGAVQAALEGTGQGVAKGAAKAAPWVMDRALSASNALAREFPELSQTMIDHALTISKGGLGKAKVLLKVAKDQVNTALNVADASGVTIPVSLTPEIAESLKTALMIGGIKSGAIPKSAASGAVTVASERIPAEIQVILNSIDAALEKGTPMALKPTEADLLKTYLQRQSKLLYRNPMAPSGPKATTLSAEELGDMAARLNDALDAVTNNYRTGNAAAQRLIGVTRAIAREQRPTLGNLPAMVIKPAVGAVLGEEAGRQTGHPIIGGLIGGALTSPQGLSREALVLAHPYFQQLLAQMPQATGRALTEFLQGQLAPSGSPTAPPGSGPRR